MIIDIECECTGKRFEIRRENGVSLIGLLAQHRHFKCGHPVQIDTFFGIDMIIDWNYVLITKDNLTPGSLHLLKDNFHVCGMWREIPSLLCSNLSIVELHRNSTQASERVISFDSVDPTCDPFECRGLISI